MPEDRVHKQQYLKPLADVDLHFDGHLCAQDERFSTAFAILQDAISQRAFPAASVSITFQGSLLALKSLGTFTYDSDAPSVATASLFDLASLTKVVATTTTAMILHERGLLDLESPVVKVVPEFEGADPRRRQVTFRHLLAHSSGLPAYARLFLEHRDREQLLRAAFTMPLTADPGSRAEYSDIGFIILGIALERLAGEGLQSFSQREIFDPLGMMSTMFNPPVKLRTQIVPSADDRHFRNKIIQGEVQDENASVLGGVAGHAGLFSNAGDLTRFEQAMLNGGAPVVHPETLALFTRRESIPAGTSRALGWDTPSAPSQSGKYFSSGARGPLAFGHLGYTGTSLWIDSSRQLAVTLLTNRTWPDCSNNAIKQVRPRFHDAVFEALNLRQAMNARPDPRSTASHQTNSVCHHWVFIPA